MRVKVKVQRAKPNIGMIKKFWVNMPDGQFFYVAQAISGRWYPMYSPGSNYAKIEESIVRGLELHFTTNLDGRKSYKKLRIRERVFSINTK